MAVILAVNNSLLQCKVPSNRKAKEVVKKVIAKFSECNGLFSSKEDFGD